MTKPLPPEMRKTKRVGDVVDWNEWRVDMLCEMWASGQFSASQIADRLGLVDGRNAVIGKIHRLGLGRKSAAEISAARSTNVLAIAERQRERATRQLERTKEAVAKAALSVAELREKRAAEGKAIIAKVEAQAAAAQKRMAGLRKMLHLPQNPLPPVDDDPSDAIAIDLPPRRYRPVLAADNPAFVARVEKPIDLYSHMRSEESLSRALAALSR